MDEMELTCICCPIGCGLRATLEAGQVVRVTGNTCPRGEAYARREAVSPMRTVTSSVAVEGGVRPVVPVKTVPDVPKDRIFPVMDAIRDLTGPRPGAGRGRAAPGRGRHRRGRGGHRRPGQGSLSPGGAPPS